MGYCICIGATYVEIMGTNHHGNLPLPLETPNQQQLQPLNDDEINHVLAVYQKIEAKVSDNEKKPGTKNVSRPEYASYVLPSVQMMLMITRWARIPTPHFSDDSIHLVYVLAQQAKKKPIDIIAMKGYRLRSLSKQNNTFGTTIGTPAVH
jgi:hypothetical protein